MPEKRLVVLAYLQIRPERLQKPLLLQAHINMKHLQLSIECPLAVGYYAAFGYSGYVSNSTELFMSIIHEQGMNVSIPNALVYMGWPLPSADRNPK
jgi:hypothetical protein